MKQRFIRTVNNLFKSSSLQKQKQIQESPTHRNRNKSMKYDPALFLSQKKIMNSTFNEILESQNDYEKVAKSVIQFDSGFKNKEKYPELAEMGFPKDQIQAGEKAVLVQDKLVQCKLADMRYNQIRLVITNYKIGLRPQNQDYTFFPLGKVEKLLKYQNSDKAFKIFLQLKDGRKFKLRIFSQQYTRKIVQCIETIAFNFKIKQNFFAFQHFKANKQLQQKFKGWKVYDPISEFRRMGIQLMPHCEDNDVKQYKSDFKILDNTNGKVCSTYPQILIVPSRMPYDSLIRCAKFRSRERLPALSYAYQYSPGKFSCVYRSSQSKVGVQNSRSTDDQNMLKLIGDPKSSDFQYNSYTANCIIYDARGYYAALGNKLAGKGFESQQNYQNCKVQFLNIPNIHAVRESYIKTLQASYGDDSKFYSGLAESKWYQYIFLILYGSLDLAKALKRGINSLVHCSDGWDRTAQLCCLASIFLDPYYRTIQGFQVSIQKDWMYFGHQFAKRLGQGIHDPTNQEKSQIFLQFLDCVSQIMYQFPSEFQFNYKLLQFLGQQAYSNLYGNFLCNCYQQMKKNKIFDQTVSVWSKIKKDKQFFQNPFYLPSAQNLLGFDAHHKNMRFWKQHFLQHIDDFKDVYNIYSCKFTENNLQIMHQHINQQSKLLKEKNEQNQNILDRLNQELKKTHGRLKDTNNSRSYKN